MEAAQNAGYLIITALDQHIRRPYRKPITLATALFASPIQSNAYWRDCLKKGGDLIAYGAIFMP